MPEYDFQSQLAWGQRYEKEIDTMLTEIYEIAPVTREEQRQGIDRKLTHRKTGIKITGEYKADHTASRTGNAFVETVSVDTINKPGWAYSSQADCLFYLIVGSGSALYVIPMKSLRQCLSDWEVKYPKRQIPNHDYHTIGLLVPLWEFEEIARAVI